MNQALAEPDAAKYETVRCARSAAILPPMIHRGSSVKWNEFGAPKAPALHNCRSFAFSQSHCGFGLPRLSDRVANSLSLTSILYFLAAVAPVPCMSGSEGDHASASNLGVSLCRVPMSTDKAELPARHPIKGVIVSVRTDKQALLVKHEEIPGVMRAMTMLLKTDAATLQRVTKGQKITGLLVRKNDGWWIESVTVIP